MFIKLLAILIILIIGVLVALLLGFAEEFAEKLLPAFAVGLILVYIFLSWYLGYFLATQRPPLTLVVIGFIGIVIAFVSGYFVGMR